MAWTTPPTLTDGTVLTGAHTQIWRDDLNLTAAALATAAGQIPVSTGTNVIAMRTPAHTHITTSEGTASTTYTNLATAGPAVTSTTGTQALVFMSSGMTQSAAGGFCNASWAVSGATTIATGVSDSVVSYKPSAVGTQTTQGVTFLQTGLTAGSNVFTMGYNAGGAGGTATFFQRELVVFPL